MSTPSSSGSGEPSTSTTPSIATRLHDANECKAEGNNHFRQSKWNEALASYHSALNLLPKRKTSEKASAPSTVDGDEDDSNAGNDELESTSPNAADDKGVDDHGADDEPGQASGAKVMGGDDTETTEGEVKEIARLRSVLFGNLGACHVKLGEHKKAVEACTQALKDDPKYIKALQRRAASNEILDTWSSLSAAQEDYNTLLAVLQPASHKLDIEAKLRKLKPRLDAAQKRETSEMLDKLKGLGNSLLGNFGLSTDNFKFEPNGQGGYSMGFVR